MLWASPSILVASRRNVVARGHQLGAFFFWRLFFKSFHGVEDAAHQAFDDGMVLGEIGPGEPDVGDQLVGVCVVTSIRLPLTFERL